MSQRRFSDPVEEQDIAASADRREGDRYRTVWRIAKVMRNGDAGLWRVRNISHPGMMLAADLTIRRAEKLVNALSDTAALRGASGCLAAGRSGVSFDKGVDVTGKHQTLGAGHRVTGYRQPRPVLPT